MPYTLTIKSQKAIDAGWFARLEAIVAGLTEIYFVLGPTATELSRLQQEFTAANYQLDLALRSAHYQLEPYYKANAQLGQLAADIQSSEVNNLVRQAYCAKIDELQHQNTILIAASQHDEAAFQAANIAVYGRPDDTVFAATCEWLHYFAASQQQHPNQQIHHVAQQVADMVPQLTADNVALVPSNELFGRVRAMHHLPGGYLAQLFAGITLPGQRLSAMVGDPITETVLANIGSSYSLQDASDVFWGVSHSRQAVLRPQSYDLAPAEFTGIIAHEVGSHLLERVNGLRQPLRLLALGLDRYEAGNEGRAYLREQIMYDTPEAMAAEPSWEHIITLHYAISLAYGLNDHPYGFAELYAALLPISQLFSSLRTADRSLAANHAHQQTWITVTRVLKGTTGQRGAYLKDIVYLQGNVNCWQIAASNPDLLLLADRGKFDIGHPEHLALLQALDILPA